MLTGGGHRKERRTEHLNITLTPSMKKDLRILADLYHSTPTRVITDTLQIEIDKNSDRITKYKELFYKEENNNGNT